MHNSTGRRTALTVILMVLMMTVFTQFVSAAPKIDTERAVSVKAYYLKDGIPLRDAEFSI